LARRYPRSGRLVPATVFGTPAPASWSFWTCTYSSARPHTRLATKFDWRLVDRQRGPETKPSGTKTQYHIDSEPNSVFRQ
jgi:hypothetical protein